MPKRTLPIAPLCALLLLCVLAYLPSLSLPLLEDDYATIWAGLHYGSWDGLPAMIQDQVARVRATVYWTAYLVWKLLGFTPWAYRLSSLILHILNCWLLYGIGLAWPRMRAAAFWAAAFFAVHEGHQEAIMWFSGNSEVLQFFFGGASLLCWIKAAAIPRHEWLLRFAGILCFVLALLSKESAFILVPLFLLATPSQNWRRSLVNLLPYCALAVVEIALVLITRAHSFRFTDGSFSLHAPVWLTLPRNFARLLWVWGFLSAALIFFTSAPSALRKSALLALAWIAIGLIPYSFLTYSSQIPSRQLYLASVGLALLFGLAMVQLQSITVSRQWIVTAVMLVMVAHNVGYIWIKKQRQFLDRAAPTEELIQVARQTPGTIWVQCFPQPANIAEDAMFIALNRYPSGLVFTAEEAAQNPPSVVFCFRRH